MSTGNTKYGDNALENNSQIDGNNSAFGLTALRDSTEKWNTAVGSCSAQSTTTGISNTSVGVNSLLQNISGSYNTALGTATMCFNINGSSNTAIGSNTMENNITGQNNTAVGTTALYTNLSGSGNVALGYSAGLNNSGDNNTFLGTGSNATNPFSSSTAIGYNSQIDASNQIKMGLDTTQVVIPGSAILTNLSTTYTNESVVPKSYIDLFSSGITLTEACVCATTTNIDLVIGGILTIDGYLTSAGDRVLVKSQGNMVDDNYNTADIDNGIYVVSDPGSWTRSLDYAIATNVAGFLTFVQNGTLNSNTAFAELTDPGVVGTDLLQYSIFYSNPFSLGDGLGISANILNVDAELSGPANPFLTFVGINGGVTTTYSLDSGSKDIKVHGLTVGRGSGTTSYNTAVGFEALQMNTTGNENTSIGDGALQNNTSGSSNTAVGKGVLLTNTIGYNNTSVGSNALLNNTTGSSNTSVGTSALQNNTTGNQNTAVGSGTLFTNTGANNTAVGTNALHENTTGEANTAVGSGALFTNITGANNTAVGSGTLFTNTGANNTAVGTNALQNNTTGTSNTAVGFNAVSSLTTGSNVTCIGNDAQPSSISVSNEITLGNSSVTTVRTYGSFSTLSDIRDKKNIQELEAGLNFVEQLKPVSFIWNMRDGGKVDVLDTGFIAQDLKQAQIDTGITIPDLVYESNPKKLEASYGKLLPVLVKAIQDLKKELDELKALMKI